MCRADHEEVARTLESVLEVVALPGTDVSWSGFDEPEQAIAELRDLIWQVRQPDPDQSVLHQISLLFAPTGALQEIAISSGWGVAFLAIAQRMDRAVGTSPPGR
ncbi:hypothetical protein [Nocardia alni]|uniref:hypothetical protein n=1 Tax=Nocardia alni TaxID=2815723 RepID=UPI001C21831D|nr:hypothetical protein [Nocardia alni]